MLSFFLRDTLSCRLYFIILSNHNLSSLSQQCENIFLFQLVALQFNAKEFLNDWVDNLAPNPTETLVPSHSYLSTLFTNHHHNPSQRKNPHWM